MQQLLKTICFVIGTVLLFTLGISIYLVRSYLPTVGLIALGSLVVCLTSGTFFFLFLGTNFTLRSLTRLDFHDIGEFGTLAQRFNRIFEYAPYAPKMGEVAATKNAGELPAPKVDLLGDVLEKGLIGVGSEKFLLGLYADNTPCYTLWDKVKSLIVAGMSGSGKSVTMVFITVQLMLSKAAKITVIDPHWSKPDGLTSRLKPLAEYATFVKGNSNTDIQEAVTEFKEMLEGRINGDEIDGARLLIIDEWNRIAGRNKEVFEDVKWIVEEIAQEGRGYLVYVMLGGQIWMPSKSGGTSIIESIQSAYVHRIKTKQARYIVDNEIAKQTEKMYPGHVFFSNADGETERLIIPESRYRDAVTVRDLLRGTVPFIASPAYQPQIEPLPRREQIAQYARYAATQNGTYAPSSNPGETVITPYNAAKMLPQGETVKEVKEPLDSGEAFTGESETGETGEAFTQEEKQLVLNAFYELCTITKGGKVTREMIKTRLGWNNKKHHIVKAVCDALGIAKP